MNHVLCFITISINFSNFQWLCAGVSLLKQFQAQFSVHDRHRQELSNAQKLFDLPVTTYSDLIDVEKDLCNMAIVLNLYEAQRVYLYIYIYIYIYNVTCLASSK